jgi:hypothetical protein
MNLQGIVAVSGKPGLWKALAQNKTGYILESLDAIKTKLIANISTSKLASLHEITIFGLDEDIKLTDVFEKMKTAGTIPDAKDGKKLREYFRVVAPDHDEEKVYASDMKKVVTWYELLKDTEFFKEEEKPAEEAVTTEEEAAKPAAKAVKAPVVTTTVPKAAPVKAAPKAQAKPKVTAKPRRAE